MNIKISIKDCDCIQNISSSKQMSEVEHKKKTMLYAPPENDKHSKQTIRASNNYKADSNNKKTTLNMNSKEYRESQKQMLNELKKNGQNQATLTMMQSGNNLLLRQNEILQQNQKALQHMASQNRPADSSQADSIRTQVKDALDQIKNEVTEIKKMRTQIVNAAQEFNKNVADLKNGRNQRPQLPNQIWSMNQDMKNLVQVSQNHLEGLQNMEALKSLQNFNMEGYSQAINQLKKQIGQYLKQSENIERELKIRTAKLEKLQMPPKFEEELYRPYQEHLSNRVKNIDLHAIRERVYEKIGGFDYGKFETDIGNLMIEARNELANFPIICKEHSIVVPDIRIDQKEIKDLDMKILSVLDQYKAERGIRFDEPKKPKEPESITTGKGGGVTRTKQIRQKVGQGNASKKPANLQKISTQPVDLAHQAKLTKESEKRATVLENEQRREKRELQQRMQKSSKQKKREDQSLQKYLENRAREELEHLYKEKKERLQRETNWLYEEAVRPTYIDLALRKQELVPKKQSPKKTHQQQRQEPPYEAQNAGNEFDKSKEEDPRNVIVEEPKRSQHADVRQIGREILKQKLKNLLGERNRSPQITHIPRPQQNANPNGQRQLESMANGFIAMINNTLTQVNSNLAKSIERKIEQNHEKRSVSMERKQQRKITIPKLEAFRPPPTFNINLAQPSMMPLIPVPGGQGVGRQPEPKKIVVETYDQYKIEDNNNYQSYEISSEDDDI